MLVLYGNPDLQGFKPIQKTPDIIALEHPAMLRRQDIHIQTSHPFNPGSFSLIGWHPTLMKIAHFVDMCIKIIHKYRCIRRLKSRTNIPGKEYFGLRIVNIEVSG